MKHIVLFVVFVLGLVFMQFVQGQTVDEVINKYIEARGGKEKLSSITSLYMEGARQMMGNEVPVKVYIVQGKLYRTEFEFGGKTGYTIVTPTAGWSYIPMRSENVDAIPEDRLKGMQGQLDIAGPLVDWAAKGNKAVLLGKETLDKIDYYKVELTTTTGKKIIYYFDAKTGLLTKTSTTVTMGGNAQEQITEYSDYSVVDGIQFPHTISNPGQGQGAGSTTFDKIEVNKPVPENLYKPSK